MYFEQCTGFNLNRWAKEINVSDFIKHNYTAYYGDAEFLEGPTERTCDINNQIKELLKKESENGGVLDIDTDTISSLAS